MLDFSIRVEGKILWIGVLGWFEAFQYVELTEYVVAN